MTSMKIDDAGPVAIAGCEAEGRHSLKDVCLFLSEYASWLLGSGATCIRLERNVNRMAAAWGCEAVMTILPRHIHMTVALPDRLSKQCLYRALSPEGSPKFETIFRISKALKLTIPTHRA